MSKAILELRITGSSRITKIIYEPNEKVLTIEYTKGGSYKYFDVPQKEFNEFNEAESVGQQCTKFLGRGYKFEKIV